MKRKIIDNTPTKRAVDIEKLFEKEGIKVIKNKEDLEGLKKGELYVVEGKSRHKSWLDSYMYLKWKAERDAESE